MSDFTGFDFDEQPLCDECNQPHDPLYAYHNFILCPACHRKLQRRVSLAAEFALNASDDEWSVFESWRRNVVGW